MARSKLLIHLQGRPLLEHVLETIRRSMVAETIVVLGHEADLVRASVSLKDAIVVLNRDYAKGMSTSLKAGFRAVDPVSEAVIVVLGDQPFVAPDTMDALIKRRAGSDAKILIPTYQGVRGNPVLLDMSLSAELQDISGDVGCRGIFGHHQEDIEEVPVNDPGILLDLDTKEQLERVLQAIDQGETLEALVADFNLDKPNPNGSSTQGHMYGRPRVDVLSLAEELRSRNEPFAFATVSRAVAPTSGEPGSKALGRSNGKMVGWVDGGCSQSVVIAEGLAAMTDGQPRLLRFSKEAGLNPSAVGFIDYAMACESGDEMDVFVEPNNPRPQLLIVGSSQWVSFCPRWAALWAIAWSLPRLTHLVKPSPMRNS